MIVDAWYMVNEFHLNLGPKDTLEALVKQIKEISQLATTADREEILRFLKTTNNKEVKDKKRILTYNVPYRLQSPFIKKYKEIDLWRRGERKIAEIINKESKLLYYFNEIQGIKSTIRIQEDWINYILKNREIIIGWLEYNIAQKVIIYRIGVNIFQRYRN